MTHPQGSQGLTKEAAVQNLKTAAFHVVKNHVDPTVDSEEFRNDIRLLRNAVHALDNAPVEPILASEILEEQRWLESHKNIPVKTLLDEMAMAALTGLIADQKAIASFEQFAMDAYCYATAMLAEKAKRQSQEAA